MEIAKPLAKEHNRSMQTYTTKVATDLLYADDVISDDPDLILPHPRMHLRRFVLEPLADIRPELILPGQKVSVGELLAGLAM